MMLLMKNNSGTKAFTLIELIIVIAVMALLAAVSFIAVNPSKRMADAKDAVRASESISLVKALEQAIAEDYTILESITIPENQPYMLVTENGDDSGTCNCNTLDRPISKVDIAGLFKSYFGDNIPTDEEAIGDDTGYYILRTNNTFKVAPCYAYGDEFVYVPSEPETITCYFDQYDVGGEEWSSQPQFMVDNTLTNRAETVNAYYGDVQLLTHSTCASETFGTISQVRIRHSGFCMFANCGVILRPVFGGTIDGDNHYYDSSATIGSNYNPWIDITNDTNAPGTWLTSDIVNLDLDVQSGGSNVTGIVWNAYKIELEVTHTP